ncbi:hypothetical protein B0H19DRAFT_1077318 [Mycena capillaripes]|nr:hypothetical protein B0H19DRAFT_1077318 [Mycena capillaripes]
MGMLLAMENVSNFLWISSPPRLRPMRMRPLMGCCTLSEASLTLQTQVCAAEQHDESLLARSIRGRCFVEVRLCRRRVTMMSASRTRVRRLVPRVNAMWAAKAASASSKQETEYLNQWLGNYSSNARLGGGPECHLEHGLGRTCCDVLTTASTPRSRFGLGSRRSPESDYRERARRRPSCNDFPPLFVIFVPRSALSLFSPFSFNFLPEPAPLALNSVSVFTLSPPPGWCRICPAPRWWFYSAVGGRELWEGLSAGAVEGETPGSGTASAGTVAAGGGGEESGPRHEQFGPPFLGLSALLAPAFSHAPGVPSHYYEIYTYGLRMGLRERARCRGGEAQHHAVWSSFTFLREVMKAVDPDADAPFQRLRG